jgi:hypothetical protein
VERRDAAQAAPSYLPFVAAQFYERVRRGVALFDALGVAGDGLPTGAPLPS